jgi:hypothetical protein
MTTHVLGSLPTYLMSFFSLTKENIEMLNKKNRAFFWALDKTCTAAQVLFLGINFALQRILVVWVLRI